MPNGGSDCCGTCWFNAKNKGEPGYAHSKDPEPDFCVIRKADIKNPFYTYCANHPHRNPGKIKTPIGPVYTGDSLGNRELLIPLSDSPENRLLHLKFLKQIVDKAISEYPIGIPSAEVIFDQLAAWGEVRAIPELERIAVFEIKEENPDIYEQLKVRIVHAAQRALQNIRKNIQSGSN
jgi:hypothetical protein